MAKDKTELAQWVCSRYQQLVTTRASWESLWQDIANFVMPRKAEIQSKQTSPDTSKQNRLFDGTAIRANQILANGQLAWMTPLETRWFAFDPPHALRGNDKVEMWYRRCTEIAILELARSNFYTEIHELYLDRGCFGTAVILAEEGRKNTLSFKLLECGTFAIAEDSEGYVDTLAREVKMTLRAAAQKFGADNLPPKLKEELAKNDGKTMDREVCFVHLIYPREEYDPEKRDGENKPIASVYVEQSEKHVVRIGGYDEIPFFATRFLKWGGHVYGWSPAWMALPESRQLNFLERQMDALAEVAAFPRILVPDGFEGTVRLKASGVTYFDPNNPNAMPKEWATGGRYDVGKDRAEVRRKAINDAYHVDLFQMFAQLDKPQMTAREVSERASEKLIQFSPTFSRMTTELFGPLLQRTFALLARAGKLPPPPQEALMAGPGGAVLPEPEVSYSSRIALAIKALENTSFYRLLEGISPLIQFKPEILDNFDFDEAARDLARNDGLPTRWIVEIEEVAKIRNARAEAQMKAEQMAEMQAGAEVAAKAGTIKPDSVAGKAMQEAMEGQQ